MNDFGDGIDTNPRFDLGRNGRSLFEALASRHTVSTTMQGAHSGGTKVFPRL